MARDLNNLGMAWHTLGDSRKAIGYLQEAYGMFREFYGGEHPSTWIVKGLLDGLKNKKE